MSVLHCDTFLDKRCRITGDCVCMCICVSNSLWSHFWLHSILQHRTNLSVLKYTYMGRREEEHKMHLVLYLRKQFFLCSMFKNHHEMQVKNQNKPNKSNLQYKPLVSLFS